MKRLKNGMSALLIFAMICTLMPSIQTEAAKKVKVGKVTVASKLTKDKKKVVVAKGKKVSLETVVTVTPDKASNKKVSYSSKNKKIATVSSKGVVKGIKAGSTKVTVTSKKNKKKKATITVKVYKGAVTKVAFAKTSGKLDVDKKETLTPTVSAKSGACKTLYWSSSDEKVATVNSKGEITALSEGKVTITAQAIDGSGKKATYALTVVDPISLTAVKVIDPQTLTISLDKKYDLDPAKISIQNKTYEKGTYRNQLNIVNISTSDKINYRITLSDQTCIQEKQFVKVSIPSLSGAVKEMEVYYAEAKNLNAEDFYLVGIVGKHVNYWLTTLPCASYQINKLPKGLTSRIEDGYLLIKGIPAEAGNTDAVFKAVDGEGNSYTRKIHFMIGAENEIVAAPNVVHELYSGDEIEGLTFINPDGGSGEYTFTILQDPDGVVTDLSGGSAGWVWYRVTSPGNHKVLIRCYDAEDTKVYCDVTVTIQAEQALIINGDVVDADGKKLEVPVYIVATNKDANTPYNRVYKSISEKPGEYKIILPKGTYDIEIKRTEYDDVYSHYIYNHTYKDNRNNLRLQVPFYKVTMTGTTDKKNVNWYCGYQYLGSGNVMYLPNGTYHLIGNAKIYEYTETYKRIETRYDYTADFTIANASKQVKAQETITIK